MTINSSSWFLNASTCIENCPDEALRGINNQLDILKTQVSQKLLKAKRSVGVGVVIIDSKQSQEHDQPYYGRFVKATFTAGINAAPFSIDFSNKNYEGDEEIFIESKLFLLETDNHTGKTISSEVTDEEITEFLTEAGLTNQIPKDKSVDLENIQQRQRFLYAEIIEEAICLVIEKYGEEDDYGVNLGIKNPNDIYEHFGCTSVKKAKKVKVTTAGKTCEAVVSNSVIVKRNLSPYTIYCTENRDTIRTENPGATFSELGRLLAKAWTEMSDAQKKVKHLSPSLQTTASFIHPPRKQYHAIAFIYNTALCQQV